MSQTKISTSEEGKGDEFDTRILRPVDVMILEERNKDLQDVESEISNLSQTFSDVSSMIYVQGIRIDKIDDALEYSEASLAEGRKKLEEAEKYAMRRRKILAALASTGIALGSGLLALAWWSNSNGPSEK